MKVVDFSANHGANGLVIASGGIAATGLLVTSIALLRMGLFSNALSRLPGRLSKLGSFTPVGLDKVNRCMFFAGLGMAVGGTAMSLCATTSQEIFFIGWEIREAAK